MPLMKTNCQLRLGSLEIIAFEMDCHQRTFGRVALEVTQVSEEDRMKQVKIAKPCNCS